MAALFAEMLLECLCPHGQSPHDARHVKQSQQLRLMPGNVGGAMRVGIPAQWKRAVPGRPLVFLCCVQPSSQPTLHLSQQPPPPGPVLPQAKRLVMAGIQHQPALHLKQAMLPVMLLVATGVGRMTVHVPSRPSPHPPPPPLLLHPLQQLLCQ